MSEKTINQKLGNERAFNNKTKPPFSVPLKKKKIEVLTEPIKSESDKKLYRAIRLENGLTALLISDPNRPTPAEESSTEEKTSQSSSNENSNHNASSVASGGNSATKRQPEFDEEKLAACALSVGVGSYSDPLQLQGLAHFVEHMVFMGSRKYPKQNEFSAFIQKNGGSYNAATDCERTLFYVEIEEKYLLQSMDMLSQFFVDPLMLKEAMQREREAVDSEFAISAPFDGSRKQQLLSSLFPEGHPARIFACGNLRSLRDEVGDDEKLYQAAHEFRRRHYSAHRMTLAVQARMSLETLQQYVVDIFGQIPTNDLPPQDFSPYTFTPSQITPEFASMYYVKPVSETKEVQLTWCLRSLLSEYQSKPHQYISYLMGHEGKGSLLSYLRKKVWALGTNSSTLEYGICYTSMYSLFSTEVVLTKEGLDHIDEVLEAIFSYINMLRLVGPNERIYNEIKAIEDTKFRFTEEVLPTQYVVNLVDKMHFLPPEHYITGRRLYYKYDPKGITELLSSLRPDKVNIMILSNKYDVPVEYDAVEKWYGTEYRRQDIPQQWLDRWSKVEPYKDFHLPEENIYLTTNFDLVPPADAYLQEATELGIDLMNSTAKELYKKVSSKKENKRVILTEGDLVATVNNFRLDQPNLLRKDNYMELWYKPDFKFRLPTAFFSFHFITPLRLKSPKDACLLDLWLDVLNQELKELVYPANMANLSHWLYVDDRGLTMKVTGYSQNLHLLVELLTSKMRAVSAELTEPMFEAVREVRDRSYHKDLIDPDRLANDLCKNVLRTPYVTLRDKVQLVHNVTLEDLQQFTHNFLDKLYVQILIQGNLAWHQAIRISENVLKNIKWEGLAPNELPQIKIHELSIGEKKLRVVNLNPTSTNSIVTNYYQCGAATPQQVAVLEVLLMLMKEPAFDQLRTKEQLGYTVSTYMEYEFGVLDYCVTVNTQVDKFSVAHVNSRIENFLCKFGQDCHRLPEKTLAATRRALVQLKHVTDFELGDEAERNWWEIHRGEYMFHRQFSEAEAIEKVKLSDLTTCVDNYLPSGNKKLLRNLSIQKRDLFSTLHTDPISIRIKVLSNIEQTTEQKRVEMVMGHKVNNVSNTTQPTVTEPSCSITYLGPLEDVEEDRANFVLDLEEFKKSLTIVPVPKVQLI